MTPLAALLVLLLVVAWLTASATAVRSVSRIWLRHWVEQRLRGASVAELYLERPQRLLLGASTGVALAVFVGGELLATAYAGGTLRLVARLLGAALLVLVLGQLVPRALARRWASRLLPVLLPGLRLVGIVIAPLLLAARLSRRVLSPSPEPASASR